MSMTEGQKRCRRRPCCDDTSEDALDCPSVGGGQDWGWQVTSLQPPQKAEILLSFCSDVSVFKVPL